MKYFYMEIFVDTSRPYPRLDIIFDGSSDVEDFQDFLREYTNMDLDLLKLKMNTADDLHIDISIFGKIPNKVEHISFSSSISEVIFTKSDIKIMLEILKSSNNIDIVTDRYLGEYLNFLKVLEEYSKGE